MGWLIFPINLMFLHEMSYEEVREEAPDGCTRRPCWTVSGPTLWMQLRSDAKAR